MSRIFLTGDIHGEIDRITYFAKRVNNLNKEDILIILGDFGVIWTNEKGAVENLEILGELPFTVAFLDGNHENFPLIARLESTTYWNGGSVGKLPGGVLHLHRGEIYQIGNKKIGVCGGADSYDRYYRTEGLDWWKTETITSDDVEMFKANIVNKGNKIDLMLSHDAPADIIPAIKLFSGINGGAITESQRQLNQIKSLIEFKKWYFGHWHINRYMNDNFECLYREIVEIR